MRRLALVALFATACGSTATSGPALALVFHPGDVYRFSFESTGHAAIDPSPPEIVHKSAHLTYTVIAVDSSGTGELSLEATDAVVTSTEGQVTAPSGTYSLNGTSELKVSSSGRFVNDSATGTAFGFGTWWALLPGRAVKPGDTWTDDFDMPNPGLSIPSHVKATSKYLRDESFQGSNAAVVESTFTSTASGSISSGAGQNVTVQQTVTSTATTWIDRAAGRILKSRVTTSYVGSYGDQSDSTPPTTVRGDDTADLLPG